MRLVDLEQVRDAARLLEGVVSRTPLERSRVLSEEAGGEIFLKCENLQRTGAFKIRGAYTRIAGLSEDERSRGVVAASAGNHAQGVALAASLLGVKSTVFMPEGASLPKVEATARYGAKVALEGSIYDEAYAAAVAFAEQSGAEMVHPFDHPDIIAGQGTVALEILDQLSDVATIIVPVGGGGLISGIAATAKGARSDIRIIGVEPEGSPNVTRALEAGHPVELQRISTIADGLATKWAGELTLAHIRSLVDELVTVSDDEIARALLVVTERAKLVVEPAGAAGVAALLSGRGRIDFPAVVVLSGGNIDPLLLLRVIRFGMGSAGRYFWFRTRVADRPGQLHRLLGVMAEAGANVVGIEHHREGARLKHLGEVEVVVQVETRGADHVEQLRGSLIEAGYSVETM
jgi:threonine dehydratase